MSPDVNDSRFIRPEVSGWRRADLMIIVFVLFAVFFTPIERETKTLLLTVVGGFGLSKTIAWNALPFIRQRWTHGGVN